MKTKQDKKIGDKKIEKQMDREFERRGTKFCVYHFTENVDPFRAVTILEYFSPSYSHARRALDAARFHQHCHSPATELLDALHRQGIWGVAICDKRDTFSRQEGRCRAKRRLLRHLKKREGIKSKKMKPEETNPNGICNGNCDGCLIACDPPCECLICKRQADCKKKPIFGCDDFEILSVKEKLERGKKNEG